MKTTRKIATKMTAVTWTLEAMKKEKKSKRMNSEDIMRREGE